MSVTVDIGGVPVQFPFPPYDIQKDYMAKVIECMENGTTAVLESPTGTGKTLSLLCSSLAWLQQKKAKLQASTIVSKSHPDFLKNFVDVDQKADSMVSGREFLGVPNIIYASRTHSQLGQAVQEMKKTAYNHMRAIVLGSRDQLCIHPEVVAEKDQFSRVHMCQLKVTSRSCHYNNQVEKQKLNPKVCNTSIIDIEDMVKLGRENVFCPYYMTRELQNRADIVFTPYNYLLDTVTRKAIGLQIANSVIILDEGHNVEKVCEESASIDIKSTDIALAIDETTHIMKTISEFPSVIGDGVQDIDPEDLANFKQILMWLEDAIDAIPLNHQPDQITSFPGAYMYEIFDKAHVTTQNFLGITLLIEKMTQFLTAQNEGPLGRKGKGLQLIYEFLKVAFNGHAAKEKIDHCYKVHVREEDTKKPGKAQIKTWMDKGSVVTKCRTLSFWCFSPGFGMDMLFSKGIKCLILTSGTLAPLKPLISELELDVKVQLENPHIVKENQICVKILPKGPDGEPLNSSYRNRNNPNYLMSLGRAIVNLTRIIPNGLLIFFPSYPIMQSCQNHWEANGIWASISAQKAIFVEPKGKDAFNATMTGYYEKIQDPNLKGAIFMGVCRGKVSEGLDFADANGRAVIITGLPYPPLKDPRVILKKRYLDSCHAKNKEFLTGQDWYSLEASRAVNQAIGRVIRHRYDYGAILLLDERFNSFVIREQLSKWLRDHIKVINKYGEVIRDLSQFFRKAHGELPAPQIKPVVPPRAEFEGSKPYRNFKFSSDSSRSNSDNDVIIVSDPSNESMVNKYLKGDNPNGEVAIHSRWKRNNEEPLRNLNKRKKITLINKNESNSTATNNEFDPKTSMNEYVIMVKSKLGVNFKTFANHLKAFRETKDIDTFIKAVDSLVPANLRYILIGMDPYIRGEQRIVYRQFLRSNNLTIPEDF